MISREVREGDIEELFDVRGATRENAAATTKGWVCSYESRIVGFCMVESDAGKVLGLAVLPEFEGRGIGKTLLSLAVEWLRSFGPPRIWLGASSDQDTRAYGFYRSLGWRPVGEGDPSGDEILVLSNPERPGAGEREERMGTTTRLTIEIETKSPSRSSTSPSGWAGCWAGRRAGPAIST